MASVGTAFFDLQSGAGKGKVRTMALRLDLVFEPNPDANQANPNIPALFVYANVGDGLVGIGNGWKKIGQRERMAGKVFYSLTIDDPSFDKPLNLMLFPTELPSGVKPNKDDPQQFEIVWNRERAAA